MLQQTCSVTRLVRLNAFYRGFMCRNIISLVILTVPFLFLPHAAFGNRLLNAWQSHMSVAESAEAKGDYEVAGKAYAKAVAIAEKERLPARCKTTALCREVRCEVLASQIESAEIHYQQLVDLIKAQQRTHTLDPEVIVWLMDLEDTYTIRQAPITRENYLKHACTLKLLAANNTQRKACMDSLLLFADYCAGHQQLDRAARTLKDMETVQPAVFGKDPRDLANMLMIQAIIDKMQEKYDNANQLGLLLAKVAENNSSVLGADLPGIYTFLGMNATAQGKLAESNEYLNRAIREGAKLKTSQAKQAARGYFSLLEQPIWSDKREDKLTLALSKFKDLVVVEQAIFRDISDPREILTQLVDAQNKRAIQCEIGGKFGEAEQLEQLIIKSVRTGSSRASAGLPAFYFLLGLNATALGKAAEAKDYYDQAMNESSKIKNPDSERLAQNYLDLLMDPIWLAVAQDKYALAASELKLLLEAESKISRNPVYQYQALSRLSAALGFSMKHAETEGYLRRCITIASLPNSQWADELPDLYLRLGICLAGQGKYDQGYEMLSRALKLEREPNGRHSASVLLWWGFLSMHNHQFSLATDKLNAALSTARALPLKKRGAMVADALEMLSSIESSCGRRNQAEALLQKRSVELEAQQTGGCKLGPIAGRFKFVFAD